VVLTAVGVGLLFSAVSVASAKGWLPPVSTLPGTVDVDSQDMALDAQGNAVAVWTAYGTWRVTQAATRPVGGSWSAPVTFSVPGEEGGWDPAVAVGANGDAVAVWSSVRHTPSGTRQYTMAATRDAGGAWSTPVALSLTGADDIGVSYEPAVVVDAQGNATAIWSEETGYASAIRTSTRPKGGDWSAPIELTAREDRVGATPRLAVDAQGDVTAIWNWHLPEYGGGIIQSATRPAAGSWSAPVDLSAADERALLPQLAVDPQGDAAAVWKLDTGDGAVQAARRTAEGNWSSAVDLSAGEAWEADVAIDPQGTATAAWETHDDVGRLVHASTSALGGTWSASVDLSVRDDANWIGAFPRVTTDPQGDVTVIWKAFHNPYYNRVTAVRREAGGFWSAPVELGEASGVIEPMRVAADPQGYVTALWSQGGHIISSVFDPVAPLLNDLAVPASGVVGKPVAMSVDPFDVWSSVTSTWDFGDGGSGSGATTEHCYSAPGEHTVKVTSTDAAANATSASHTITIEPDPTFAPGADPCAPPDPGPGPEPEPGPAPGPGPSPGPRPLPGPSTDPGPGPSATAALVSGLQQSSSRWRTRAVHRRPRLPVGTTFRFRLNRAADVRFAFSQIVPGRRATTARCVKPTKANRDKPRCSRYQTSGTLNLTGTAGSNAYTFRGKIHGRTLKPGRYRLSVTALHDGTRSAAATITFTIAR
jgi:hypothetical protein